MSVKENQNEGMGLYALDSPALTASRHGRGVLDGVVVAKFGVLRNPDFWRESQVKHGKE